jgi:hypothetical protein
MANCDTSLAFLQSMQLWLPQMTAAEAAFRQPQQEGYQGIALVQAGLVGW